MLRPLTKNFSGLQSLDKQFDDGFFNSFSGFIKYSLNSFSGSTKYSLDFFGGFIRYGLDSIELLSVDMDFSSNYSRSVSSLIVLTKFFQLVSDLDKKFRSVFFQSFQYGSAFFCRIIGNFVFSFCRIIGNSVLFGECCKRSVFFQSFQYGSVFVFAVVGFSSYPRAIRIRS